MLPTPGTSALTANIIKRRHYGFTYKVAGESRISNCSATQGLQFDEPLHIAVALRIPPQSLPSPVPLLALLATNTTYGPCLVLLLLLLLLLVLRRPLLQLCCPGNADSPGRLEEVESHARPSAMRQKEGLGR